MSYEVNYQIFESSNELADYLVNHPAKWSRNEMLSGYSEERLRYGDQVNVKALKGDIKTFGRKNVVTYDFAGRKPVIQRAVMNNPYAFQNIRKQFKENKFITIIYDQSVPWNYSAQTMIENGKKLIATLKYLEQNGFRIKLYACASALRTELNMMLLKLKDFNEPFSTTRIAFSIANPQFLRNAFFAWVDRNPDTQFQGGYGSPAGSYLTSNTMAHELSLMFGSACIVCNNYMVSEKNFSEKLLEQSEALIKLGHKSK